MVIPLSTSLSLRHARGRTGGPCTPPTPPLPQSPTSSQATPIRDGCCDAIAVGAMARWREREGPGGGKGRAPVEGKGGPRWRRGTIAMDERSHGDTSARNMPVLKRRGKCPGRGSGERQCPLVHTSSLRYAAQPRLEMHDDQGISEEFPGRRESERRGRARQAQQGSPQGARQAQRVCSASAAVALGGQNGRTCSVQSRRRVRT